MLLGLVALGNRCVGRSDAALATVESALAMASDAGQPLYDAELHRLAGELVAELRDPEDPEVEQRFERALEVARSQQAKSYELRAAMSLGGLLQRRGDSGRARELLGGVYDWFSEGFDTPDLMEAKALLDEWS